MSVVICAAVVRADGVVGQGAWWNQSTPPQGGPTFPPLGALVTSAGIFFSNAELAWVRSHDPTDTVELIVGESVVSDPQYVDQWVYLASSECLAWNEGALGCLDSRMLLGLTPLIDYEVIAWTEAADRTDPERQMAIIVVGWTFRPADVNMDSVVDCADLDGFTSSPYDWNLDGAVTDADLDAFSMALTAARADVDGDGVVGIADILALLGGWAECPPEGQCPGDLDCSGTVGIDDYLILMNVIAGGGKLPAAD